jgi:hypothetical protein
VPKLLFCSCQIVPIEVCSVENVESICLKL